MAKCSNPTCTSSTLASVDTENAGLGWFSSIAIGTDGNPVISYLDSINETLKVAVCDDPACESATVRTLGASSPVGSFVSASILIGTDGNPVISYFFNPGDSHTQIDVGTLNVAACNDPSCSSVTITVLDSSGVTGQSNAITLDTNGLPAISYYDRTNEDLKLARCSNASCTSAELSVVDSTGRVGGWRNSIASLPDGRLVIAYMDETNYCCEPLVNQPLKVAVIPAE